MADSNCSFSLTTNPYNYIISTAPSEPDDPACITIDKCEKGFIVTHCDKEYACESLHSAYEIIKKLFSPDKKSA